MTKREQYEQAANVIASRNQRAKLEAAKRRNIAVKRIPQIAQMEAAMSQSTIRLSKLILSKATNATETIPRIMQENLAAQRKIGELLVANGFHADYLKVKYTCDICNDTGVVDGKRCSCFQSVVKQIAIQDFNRSTGMSLATFEDFKLHYYSDQNRNESGCSDFETMSQILRFCRDYAELFSPNSPSILMIGGTGLGKTHLSLSIANEVIQKGYTVLYGSAQEYFTKIQNEHFGKNRGEENTAATIEQADLFILDDLGAEFESSFNISAFYNILNARLNHNKPTIINTNLTLQEIETRYTNRVLSRLMGLYKTLKFVGKDIRQLKLNGK